MKKGNLEKWTDIESCKNLLFFSQLVNELLFDYSIPSNRISTLNSHYLCLDAISTIKGIEENGVHEGNLKPIMEEFYTELSKDPVFQNDNSPLDYFVKYQKDKYVTCAHISDIGFRELKSSALAINKLFFSENRYYEQLKKKITEVIKNNKTEEQQILFRMTKSLLTELMNSGYSLKYLYMIMDMLFWNSSASIDNPDIIEKFFEHFTFTKNEYTVVFKGKKQKIAQFVNYAGGLSCVDELPEKLKEKADSSFRYRRSDSTFLIIKEKDFDPYSSCENVTRLIETNMAVYRLYDHYYRYHIRSAKCEIFDDQSVYKIGHKLKGVEHTKTPSSRQITESMNVVNSAMKKIARGRNYHDFAAIIGAIEYHAHSLDSLSEENQLLDLWSIFESVLDISNKHTSDRIQQVCVSLVPLLKQKYIYSLFKQLSDDIRYYNEDAYNTIISDAVTEADIVKRICCFTLLDNDAEQRERFLNSCTDFPLLAERISYYHDVLQTPAKIFLFVEKHAERVRWQIMRIYRNRNMIIHNGNKMPYLSLLIENLHSYVDDFISYTIHSLAEGKDVNSMCQELFVKECKWNNSFMRKKNPVDEPQIDYILSM